MRIPCSYFTVALSWTLNATSRSTLCSDYVAQSMLKKVPHFGYVLTDSFGLPRYWAAAWTLLIGGSLAESTLKKKLSNIEAFYQHAEDSHDTGALDDALGSQNLSVLEGLLESYFVTLRNVPLLRSSTEQRWRDVVSFVREMSERLTRTPDLSARLADVTQRLERLDRLYGQPCIAKRTSIHFVRALPAAVLDELSDLVQPGRSLRICARRLRTAARSAPSSRRRFASEKTDICKTGADQRLALATATIFVTRSISTFQ
jgi:hypothetical protein